MNETQANLRCKPSVELIRNIASEKGSTALDELIEHRRVFLHEGKRLLLTEFLWQMREKYQKHLGSKKIVDEVIDHAYDLTLAKFTNIPAIKSTSPSESSDKTSGLKHARVNCRKYYGAILKMLEDWQAENPEANSIEKEAAVGRIFQGMVVKHFYFSMIESRRSMHPLRKRYLWKIGNKSITLRHPAQISGRYFREWLEKHFPDPDPNRPGEKERIQYEVDGFFTMHSEVPLDDRWATYELAKGGHLLADSSEYSWMPKKVDELMLTVAEEKTQNIDQMRPAIRDLGKNSLY